MIKKIIPKEIQQSLMVGVTVFVLLFIFGARNIVSRHNIELRKVNEQRARVKLENRVGEKLSELIKLKKKMVVINESSRFLAEVAKLAGQLNMKLKAITALPREKRNELTKLSVSLEVDTNYNEMSSFIAKLESNEVFMTVEKLEMSSVVNADNAKSPKIIAKLIVSTMALTDTILEK